MTADNGGADQHESIERQRDTPDDAHRIKRPGKQDGRRRMEARERDDADKIEKLEMTQRALADGRKIVRITAHQENVDVGDVGGSEAESVIIAHRRNKDRDDDG